MFPIYSIPIVLLLFVSYIGDVEYYHILYFEILDVVIIILSRGVSFFLLGRQVIIIIIQSG